jgi:Protein of unknown function (DUF1549)/Protein of unknown function (DUF1553)
LTNSKTSIPNCRSKRPLAILRGIAGLLILTLPVCADETVGDTTVSFRNDVMAILSKAGCNRGSCHGNQHGKGGFKLSLRGQDSDADFHELTRHLAGRRVNILQPAESMLLQKPLMKVPHEGGQRFDSDSRAHQILFDWIAAGIPADAADLPQVVELQIEPQHHTVEFPIRSVQLQVIARFDDDTRRDVTHLSVFESSDPSVNVSNAGIVEAESPCLTVVTIRYLAQQEAVRLEFVAERPDYRFSAPASQGVIDDAVFAQLKRLKITPSPLCDDTTFLRRAYLDLTGLLPPASDAREFMASTEPEKRSQLVDRLLDSPQFDDYQTLRWSDLLRVEDKTLDEKGVRVFHKWIRDSFANHKPLNVFVRELIAARGSTYKVPQANFYRALRKPDERAETCAQLFLGIRLQCAKCHNHPYGRWTQDDYYSWTNLFARVDYEIVENKRRDKNDKHEFNGGQIVQIKPDGDVKNPSTGRTAGLRFLEANEPLDAEAVKPNDDADLDRLQQLANWLTAADNRRFAEMQANRIWYQLLGRGVVDPIDDFRGTNPPANPELLAALTDALIASDFDIRHLMRMIMNSSTYQLSSETNAANDSDDVLFSHIQPRRLTAEQTIDAVAAALNVDIPFGGHDHGIRAVQLMGVRNGGNRYSKPEMGDRFLKLFGKPNRLQSCECERSDETTLAQTFEMISGELVGELIQTKRSRITRALSSDQSTSEFVSDLYWSALSRAPTNSESKELLEFVATSESRRTSLEDIAWAVLNSNEFLLRH